MPAHRPTPEELDAEYTGARLLHLGKQVSVRLRIYSEDLQQDAALAAMKRIQEYKEGRADIPESYSFYFWLWFKVLGDVKQQHKTRRRRMPDHALEFPEPSVRDLVLDLAGDRLDLAEALTHLTPLQSQLIQLYYFEHKSQVEIAEELGIAQPNVAKGLARAHAKLKEALQ